MSTEAQSLPMAKIRLCLSTFGVIVGIVGILHGCAEVVRGSTLVESRSVEALPEAWPNVEFRSMTRGSPAFTILTDIPFYVLGLLAILVSITLIVSSVTVIRTKDLRFAAIVLAVLSVGIFLFGAGRGTPVVVSLPAVITALIATARPNTTERTASAKHKLLVAFNSFYWLHIASWLLFFPGLFVFSFYADIPTALFVVAFVSMPIGTLGALVAGYRFDTATVAVSASTPRRAHVPNEHP